MFSSTPIAPLPLHLELSTYFHELVHRFRRADADERDFSTIFGLSGDPLYTLHLVLQRADDDALPPMNPGLILPPALRTSLPRDVLERYKTMSYVPR